MKCDKCGGAGEVQESNVKVKEISIKQLTLDDLNQQFNKLVAEDKLRDDEDQWEGFVACAQVNGILKK